MDASNLADLCDLHLRDWTRLGTTDRTRCVEVTTTEVAQAPEQWLEAASRTPGWT